MNKNNKSHRIYVRCTEDEIFRIRDKAKNYPNVSSYVLDACMNFDDSLGINRLHIIKEWCIDFHNFESEINKLGSNINQIAHYVNKLSSTGVLLSNFVPELILQYDNLISLLTEIKNSNMYIQKQASDFFTRKKK